MIKMSTKTLTSLIVAVGTEIAVRDREIERHHEEIEQLTETVDERTRTLTFDNNTLQYKLGDMTGQLKEVQEQLQRAEDSNKNLFNLNQELGARLDNYLDGTPPTLATKENIRKLLLALKTNDVLIIGEAVHVLMDTPLVEAVAFVTDTLGLNKSGVLEETSKEVETQVG